MLVRGRAPKTGSASVVVLHIPTGFPPLDQALGIGGFPTGTIVELTDQGTSGKTMLALKFLARARGNGGRVGYVDQAHYFDPDEPLLLNTLRADVHSRLIHPPYVVDRLMRLLRRRWLHLALDGGLRLWLNVHYTVRARLSSAEAPSNDELGLTQHAGVVWIDHATAMPIAKDYDGDYFLLTSATDCLRLTAEIESWRERPVAEVVKVKERLTSPRTESTWRAPRWTTPNRADD